MLGLCVCDGIYSKFKAEFHFQVLLVVLGTFTTSTLENCICFCSFGSSAVRNLQVCT